MNTKVGFIGGGNMAACMIGGLANPDSDSALIDAQDVWVYDRNQHKIDALVNQHSIRGATSCKQIIELCDVIILAVKPQALKEVLKPLINDINTKQPLLISVAVGVQCKTIERWIGNDIALVRVMPNTPSLIGLGVSGLYANQNVSEQYAQLSNNLMQTIGITHWVEDESGIDLVIALSGSGPAYFMLFIQSLVDAAVNAGMDEGVAKELAIQTSIGAAELIKHSEESIPQLIKNISSPNGTTEQAVNSLKHAKLADIVSEAFTAAKQRAEQMAIELDT